MSNLLDTPKLGFGCMRLPLTDPKDQKSIDIEHLKKMVDAFIEAGGTYFDTAYVYHEGESEVAMRKALVERYPRDSFTIATKCLAWAQPTAEDAKACLDTSLKRLGTDYIDIYQFHNPAFCPRPGGADGLYDAALEARSQGKIRHISITNHRLAVAHEAIDSGLYDTLQFPFSYLSGPQELELVEKCRAADMGFIAMKGLAGGLIRDGLTAAAFMEEHPTVLPIWGVQRQSELDQFLSCVQTSPTMTEKRQAVICRDRDELAGDFCRGCGYCMPCPAGIEINNCARMSLMLRRAPAVRWLTPEWQEKMEKIQNCLHCGACKAKCPYGLDTPRLLEENYRDYQQVLSQQKPGE